MEASDAPDEEERLCVGGREVGAAAGGGAEGEEGAPLPTPPPPLTPRDSMPGGGCRRGWVRRLVSPSGISTSSCVDVVGRCEEVWVGCLELRRVNSSVWRMLLTRL